MKFPVCLLLLVDSSELQKRTQKFKRSLSQVTVRVELAYSQTCVERANGLHIYLLVFKDRMQCSHTQLH